MTGVETAFDEGIATITMTDTAKRNALGAALTGALAAALEDCRRRGARAVILRAPAGTRVWSAGYDVSELEDVAADALGSSESIRHLIRTIEAYPAPVIALLQGGVWGAACELAFVCDILVATPEVTFAITPAKLGLMFNVSGMLALMRRMPLGLVKEMAFTAACLDAQRAERLGVVNHVVAADELDGFVKDLAGRIAALAPLSIAAMKEEMRVLADVVAFSPQTMERIQRQRRTVFASDDYAEGLAAFRDKRAPRFRGT
jgi:methylmalonyl-CoA decarboxylase